MPNYVKTLAVAFLFILAVSTLGIYMYDLVQNITVPSVINTILGAAVATSLHVLGLSYGMTIGENNVVKSQKDQTS